MRTVSLRQTFGGHIFVSITTYDSSGYNFSDYVAVTVIEIVIVLMVFGILRETRQSQSSPIDILMSMSVP